MITDVVNRSRKWLVLGILVVGLMVGTSLAQRGKASKPSALDDKTSQKSPCLSSAASDSGSENLQSCRARRGGGSDKKEDDSKDDDAKKEDDKKDDADKSDRQKDESEKGK